MLAEGGVGDYAVTSWSGFEFSKIPRSIVIAVGDDILDRCPTERLFSRSQDPLGEERHEYARYAELTSLH